MADAGLASLADALVDGAPCASTLRRLDLANNQLTHPGMADLARVLRGGVLPRLEVLNLSMNRLEGEGARELSRALMPSAQQSPLRVLKLNYVEWEDDEGGLETMASAFQAGACPRLERLEMSRSWWSGSQRTGPDPEEELRKSLAWREGRVVVKG